MNTKYSKSYSNLNAEQKLAVDTIDGPVIVVAGPGTGKTQTLAMRIANILEKTDTDPSSILALTFTEAGTKAMKSRLKSLIGTAAYYVNITTFHGFCAEVIRENPDLFSISPTQEPLSSLRHNKLIQSLLKSPSLQLLKPLGAPGFYVQSIIKSISDLKREGYTPKTFKDLVHHEQEASKVSSEELSRGAKFKAEKNLQKNLELVGIFQDYEALLRKNGDYDFDDMVKLIAELFVKKPDILLSYQERFQYFLVDEYQDTNAIQNSVVDSLVSYWGACGNIFVVGDPDQCIMRFQGASMENILGFQARYPTAKFITLEKNYRSAQVFLDAAYRLIINNKNPASSQLTSITTLPGNLAHATFTNGAGELTYLCQSIQKLLASGTSPSDIAIIYRHNYDAEELGSALDGLGIAHVIQGGGNLFEDPIIRELRKLLKLLVELRTNQGDLDLFTVLHYPYFGILPLDILRLTRYASSHKLGLWEVLIDDTLLNDAKVDNPPPLQAFRSLLLSWQTFEVTHTATELVETIFEGSGLMNYCLQKPDSHLAIARIKAFFAEVKSINAASHELSARDLVEDLALMDEQNIKLKDVSKSEGESAVTLTTAHSAKGLEWSHVYIYKCIDGSWGNNRSINLISLPTSIIRHQNLAKKEKNEDERRLLYVALTRAKESCVITSAATYRQGGIVKEAIPSMFLSEIPDSLLTRLEPSGSDLEGATLGLVLGSDLVGNPARSDPEGHLNEQQFLSPIISTFRLSPTALNTYLECAYKFKLNNLLKVPRAKAPYLALGTAVHASLEALYKNFNETKTLPTLDYVLHIFDLELEREIMRKSDLASFMEKGKKILSTYYEYYKDDIRPALWMEKFLGYGTGKIILDDDIELAGKVDRIDALDPASNSVRVVDYKTGHPKTRGQVEGTTKDSDGGYYRQLVFYKLLVDLDKKFVGTMTEAQLDFVEPDDKGEFRRYSFTITKEEVDELKDTIRTMMKSIRNFEFPRTTDYKTCESCDFLDHCYPNGLLKD
ncbi:MAG: ATP-dependent DNA helicase [bacterium]